MAEGARIVLEREQRRGSRQAALHAAENHDGDGSGTDLFVTKNATKVGFRPLGANNKLKSISLLRRRWCRRWLGIWLEKAEAAVKALG
jgi:hypothetical protein